MTSFVRVKGQVNDTPKSISMFAKRLTPVLSLKAGAEVLIDLNRCSYLGPDAAAMLYACVLKVQSIPVKVDVRLPDDPPQLRSFCHFSGLRHRLYAEPEPDFSDRECMVVPLRKHSEAKHDDVEPIFQLIRAYGHLDNDRALSLGMAFNEVVQNVADHSKSPIGAVSSARYLHGQRQVRVALVDMGLGIGTTLRRAHPDISSTADALGKALRGGFSARSRINNGGQGLSNLRLFVDAPGGSMFILSQNALASAQGAGEPSVQTLDFDFPGTSVFFTLPTVR